jgi:glycosyltransferase involved in cell wall biosynthesis
MDESARARPVRLGLVIGQLTVGGAEGQLAQVVRGLDDRFTPVVFSLSAGDGAMRDELSRLGVPVHAIGSRGFARARALALALNEQRIDLVHAWLFIANAYVMSARLLGARARVITSARNCKVQGRVSQLANALAFRSSSAIVVNSRDVEAYIRRHYWAPAGRVRLIHNGIDIDRFHPRAGANRSTGPIITVGRLVPQKNHELFLRAAADLARELPEQRFIVVGDGPLRSSLEKQAGQLGISSKVTFTGERRDVDELLRDAALFWLTSRWEGMPNAVLEALASGVPAIAADVGGTRELIRDGIDGYVVPSGDAAAFVARSLELLRDPQRLAAFRSAARARAQEFSLPRMVAALRAVYDEVMSEL